MGKPLHTALSAVAVAVVAIGGLACAYVYAASERYLRDVEVDPGFTLSGVVDDAMRERGRHVARTRGCFGCHGQQLQGLVFEEEWDWVDRAVAPNLALYAREHSASDIEAAVRQGIGHDGRALWSMPSYNFALLSDRDVSALVAFLQSAPVVETPLPTPRLGWAARWRIVRGQAQHMADWADAMPALSLTAAADAQLARGEYLAKTACNECHGFDLRGQEDIDQSPPDLAILTAYSDADFRTLMERGEALGGRSDLGLMTMVARDRFAYFSEEELQDLLAYLRTLPGQPVDQGAAWRKLR